MNNDFEAWYSYVNGRISMRVDAEEQARFIAALLKASCGQAISRTAFVLAHATYYAEGVIPNDVFSERKEEKLSAINQFGTDYKSVIAFLSDYLDQLLIT